MPIRYLQSNHHKSSSGYSGASSHTHNTLSSSSEQYDDNSHHVSECSGDSGSYHPTSQAFKVHKKPKPNKISQRYSNENTSDEPNNHDVSPVREKISFYHRKGHKIASNFQASHYISKEKPPFERTVGDGACKEVTCAVQKSKNPLTRVFKHYKKVQRSDSMPVKQNKNNELDEMIKTKYVVKLKEVTEQELETSRPPSKTMPSLPSLPSIKRTNSSKVSPPQQPLTYQNSDSVAYLSNKVQLTRSSTTKEYTKSYSKKYYTVTKNSDSLCRSIKLNNPGSSSVAKSNTIAVSKKHVLKPSKSSPVPKSDPALIEYEASVFKRKYEITSKIGVGGGGTVYGGFRKDDKLQVAVKQISKSKIKRWGTTLDGRKIPQELELLTKVSGKCKNIISLYEWFERKSSFILIMEKPQNCIDLFDFINQKGPLSEPVARKIIVQVANSVNWER